MSLCLISILGGCLGTGNAGHNANDGPAIKSETIKLRASLYYLALETDYPMSDNEGIFRGPEGNVLYRGSREFREKASIEGSAKLKDARVLNYHSRIGGQIRWAFVDAPYGLGVRCPLVPMRSAAVDPAVVPLNSVLHIKETVGIELPDGSRHDGVWYAVDAGSAIKGDRIDLFTGAGVESMRDLAAHGIDHLSPLTARIIGEVKGCP